MTTFQRIARDDLGEFLAKDMTRAEKKRQRIEAKMQKAFALWCSLCLPRDVLWFSIPNERKPSEMGDLIQMGMRPGAADICLICEGRVYFIEFKTKAGIQSEKQERFEIDCEAAGAEYVICRSSEAASAQVAAWGIPNSDKKYP